MFPKYIEKDESCWHQLQAPLQRIENILPAIQFEDSERKALPQSNSKPWQKIVTSYTFPRKKLDLMVHLGGQIDLSEVFPENEVR